MTSGSTSNRPWPSLSQPSARARSVSFALDGSPRTDPSGVPVPGVPDQLLVPDARASPGRRVRGEHGDGGPDPAMVRGGPQVGRALRRDTGGGVHLPAVADLEALPVQAADAAAAVAPGHPGTELQFVSRVPVGAGQADLPADFPQPGPGRARAGDLTAVHLDELGRGIHVHRPGRPAGPAASPAVRRAVRNARAGHSDRAGRAAVPAAGGGRGAGGCMAVGRRAAGCRAGGSRAGGSRAGLSGAGLLRGRAVRAGRAVRGRAVRGAGGSCTRLSVTGQALARLSGRASGPAGLAATEVLTMKLAPAGLVTTGLVVTGLLVAGLASGELARAGLATAGPAITGAGSSGLPGIRHIAARAGPGADRAGRGAQGSRWHPAGK